jgi:ATP-dependent Clp protease ATP-binding subunit ClpX
MNVTAHWNKYDYVEIDISNILFICAGSFSDMEDDFDGKSVGFFEAPSPAHREVSSDELVRYGFLPELLGRLPVRVELDELSPGDLVAILTEPREAMIPEYQRLCALDQIQLEFSREALFEIAHAARKQHLGARALRAILEKVLHPILFVGPERAGERIIVEPDDVRRVVSQP